MSEDESGGGETNLLFSCCDACVAAATRLSTGEAERLARWTGEVGPAISAGGAREPCERRRSLSCDMLKPDGCFVLI